MYARYAEMRDERGYTDNKVATLTGIPVTTLYDWKRRSETSETAGISVSHAAKIAKLFGVSIEELAKED